jgi:hypothetical protein
VFETHVVIETALRAQVADGSETSHQGGPGMGNRPGCPFGAGFLGDLVVPGYLVIRMEEKMGMSLDKTGEQGTSRKVRYREAIGVRGPVAVRDSHDMLAPNQYPTVGMQVCPIKYKGGVQQVGGRILGSGRSYARRCE